MIRLLLMGVWGAAVALGASAATNWWTTEHKAAAAIEEPHAVEQKKLKLINVPILADGQVQGYVVAQFLYTADSKALKALAAPPDAIIQDEAFRMIYGEEKLDFRDLKKIDLGKLTSDLRARVVKRMNSEIVKEILLQEFSYVSRDDVRK